MTAIDLLRRTAVFTLVATTFACGDDGGGESPQEAPTFTEVYTTILSSDKCIDCHDSSETSDFFRMQYVDGGSLDFLTQRAAYDGLVGVLSKGNRCDALDLPLVDPGDADNSLLVTKVEQDPPPCGEIMPLLMDPLTTAERELIRGWVAAGARDD